MRIKNLKLDQRKLYVILMEGSNGIYFTGDRWQLAPVKLNQVEARKALFRCKELMKNKSTALKGTYIPRIKRWEYLTHGIPEQMNLPLKNQ